MLMLRLFAAAMACRSGVDFGGGGGDVVAEPVRVGDRSAREQLPSLDASPRFLLFHHPRQWGVRVVNGEAELVPAVQHIAIEPGTGGTDEYGDPSALITARRRDGWILLAENWATPDDTPDHAAGYVRRVRVRQGYAHITAWQSVRVLAGTPSIRTEEAGWLRWLRRLMADGLIPAPDPEVLEQLLERAKEREQRAGSRDVRGNAAAASLLERAEQQRRHLEEVSERGTGQIEDSRMAALETELERLRAKKGGRADG